MYEDHAAALNTLATAYQQLGQLGPAWRCAQQALRLTQAHDLPFELVDSYARLARLSAEIAALNPHCVISLGDGFDDDAAAGALEAGVTAGLHAMARGRDWIWIAGNHDPRPEAAALPGRMVASLPAGPVTLRHHPEAEGPDIAGHFHPVVRLAGGRRRALLVGEQHMILPAFGSYTGGLAAEAPAISRWVPGGFAIACMHRALAVPL